MNTQALAGKLMHLRHPIIGVAGGLGYAAYHKVQGENVPLQSAVQFGARAALGAAALEIGARWLSNRPTARSFGGRFIKAMEGISGLDKTRISKFIWSNNPNMRYTVAGYYKPAIKSTEDGLISVAGRVTIPKLEFGNRALTSTLGHELGHHLHYSAVAGMVNNATKAKMSAMDVSHLMPRLRSDKGEILAEAFTHRLAGFDANESLNRAARIYAKRAESATYKQQIMSHNMSNLNSPIGQANFADAVNMTKYGHEYKEVLQAMEDQLGPEKFKELSAIRQGSVKKNIWERIGAITKQGEGVSWASIFKK